MANTHAVTVFIWRNSAANDIAAGGAPNMPRRAVWSPNRLSDWCATLVNHFDGETVERGDL